MCKNALEIEVPEALVEYISEKTGVSKEVVRKILKAERMYYLYGPPSN